MDDGRLPKGKAVIRADLLRSALADLRALRKSIALLEKQKPPHDGEVKWSLTVIEGYLLHEQGKTPSAEVESLPLFAPHEPASGS